MKIDQINVGIIGLGIGADHAEICSTLSNVHLKAVSDVSLERLNNISSKFNIPETYQDGFEMIEKAGLDAVIIAVPNHLHAEFTIRAFQKGLHVLVEKPIASNIADAEAMITESRKTGKILMINFNQRFRPLYLAARNIITQGTLGKIYHARTKWIRRNGIPWWYENGSKGVLSGQIAGGGPLMDLGVHQLDLSLYMMDFPELVSVDGTTFRGLGKTQADRMDMNFELEDAGVGLIRFKDNRTLILESGWIMHCKNNDEQETLLYGEKGGMHLSDTVEVYYEKNGRQVDKTVIEDNNSNPGWLTGHFSRVLQGAETPIVTGEQALTGLQIVKAIYESAQTGKTVYFDE